jgi:uncharacterized protein (TIGR02270 family)
MPTLDAFDPQGHIVDPVQALAFDLCEEHFEEASFLYEQRRDVLLDDPELAWTGLDDFDERLEAHLDGLVLGEDLALAVCRQQAAQGDAGELYAAVCVYCRQQRKDLLDEVIDGLDADDEERLLAVRDALAVELPEAWEHDVIGWLDHDEEWRRRVAAYVIGYRRLPASELLLEALAGAAPEDVPELIRTLGRAGNQDARAPLWKHLVHDDKAIRYEAALALLRLGGKRVVPRLATNLEVPGAMLLLAISGAADHRVPMQEHLVARGPTPEGLLALGLLGALGCVEGLIHYLQDPAFAEASALGLHVLTGAALTEEAFVPEGMDEDELFEDEVEAYRRGELPKRPDGEPFGETVERLSQDPAVWEAWWEAHGARFQPGVRYRLGEPCTPRSLVRTIEAERVPRSVRQMAYDELVVRYTIDAPFESSLPVREQRRVIADLERQAAQRDAEVKPGAWYFARQRIEY